MRDGLSDLRNLLLRGIKASMQSSYARRMPEPEALKDLENARLGLRRFIEEHPNESEAWRLLSQAEECVINYGDAIRCLEQALALSGNRQKKDLKRLALLKQSHKHWEALPLSPEQLRQLGEFLDRHGAGDASYGSTLQMTKLWLMESGVPNEEAVIRAFSQRGAKTDFEVLYKVVRG